MDYCQKCGINIPNKGQYLCSECHREMEIEENFETDILIRSRAIKEEDDLQQELFEEHLADHPDWLLAQEQLAERSQENQTLSF